MVIRICPCYSEELAHLRRKEHDEKKVEGSVFNYMYYLPVLESNSDYLLWKDFLDSFNTTKLRKKICLLPAFSEV